MTNFLSADSRAAYQHTLKARFTCVGRGVHTGENVIMTVAPAGENSGITFYRTDLPRHQQRIGARWHNVTDTNLATTLTNSSGASIQTVEHIIAALQGCEIDNADIFVKGPEVPIMDGSAKVYVEKIRSVGVQLQKAERKIIVIEKPIEVVEPSWSVRLEPFPEPWMEMEIDFPHEPIGRQRLSIPLNRRAFETELAASRTFGFSEHVDALRELGFARGGSLFNSVLVSQKRVMNPDGLRWPDEFVRHKCLDAVGDLALMGAPFYGKFVGVKSGHRLNHHLVKALIAENDSWSLMTVRQAKNYWAVRDGGTLHTEAI